MHTFLALIRPLLHSLTGTLLFTFSGTIAFITGKLLIDRHQLFSSGELFLGAGVVVALIVLTFYSYLVLGATEVRKRDR